MIASQSIFQMMIYRFSKKGAMKMDEYVKIKLDTYNKFKEI